MKLYMFRTVPLPIIRGWTEELSETCRVSCQNKLVKFVHLFGFIIKEIRYDARSHERKKSLKTLVCITDGMKLQTTKARREDGIGW